VEKYFPNPDGRRVYICGLTAMIEATQQALLGLGYRKEQIVYERYD
jgi:ferredoxin-NADP reductase